MAAHSALELNLQSWGILPQPSPTKCFPRGTTFLRLLTSRSESHVSESGGRSQVTGVCASCRGHWNRTWGAILGMQGSLGSIFHKYNRMLFQRHWTAWKEMTNVYCSFLMNKFILLFINFVLYIFSRLSPLLKIHRKSLEHGTDFASFIYPYV